MPDNAIDLWEAANGDSPPNLEGCNFAVCALGDTSYEFFCQSGKDWDAWFEKQGATRVVDRVDCDVEYDDPAAEFTASALSIFASLGGGAPAESDAVNESDADVAPPVEDSAAEEGESVADLTTFYHPVTAPGSPVRIPVRKLRGTRQQDRQGRQGIRPRGRGA